MQSLLPAALRANVAGGRTPHVLLVLPSYDVSPSVLEHYGPRLPALEHRYVCPLFMLPRFPGAQVVYVCSVAPQAAVLDYYLSLLPEADRAAAAGRFHVLSVGDRSFRPVAAKLLDRPDLLSWIRGFVGGRPALIEPWNVAELEEELALRLGLPLNGTPRALWPLGFKSAGRRLLRRAGVPTPRGREDVVDPAEAQDVLDELRAEPPGPDGIVLKLDNSVAGDGVMVLRHRDGVLPLSDLPDWFVAELRRDGGVAEELVSGPGFASPSVQLDLAPDGSARVLSTHEQLLGGPAGQVYEGCRFPADPGYAVRLARHGEAIGAELARHGVLGRVSVDFVAVRRGGAWDLRALEMNLRKGGTTHTFSVLRHLVPGRYDAGLGRWVGVDGSARCYRATDNLVDDAWLGLAAEEVIAESSRRGLTFDPRSGVGAVLHMFECLSIDGRIGVTAVGRSRKEADDVYAAVAALLHDLGAARRASVPATLA